MNKRVELLLPVGRLVQGSIYEPQTKNIDGAPLIIKNGPNMGKPRQDYHVAIAIKKGAESHWSQTQWGALIYNFALTAFPNGQTQIPSFAWKIIDGDSAIPNRKNKKPCDRPGHPGHWILHFNGGFAPSLYTSDGSKPIPEINFLNLGDYVQLFGDISANNSQQTPGIYLNHKLIAFSGYGERIAVSSTVDPTTVGFGGTPLPDGASPIPLTNGFNPLPIPPIVPAALTPVPIVPYPQILTPPIIPVPAALTPVPRRKMTAKANGGSYEQYQAAGWSDELLLQQGMME